MSNRRLRETIRVGRAWGRVIAREGALPIETLTPPPGCDLNGNRRNELDAFERGVWDGMLDEAQEAMS